MSKGITFFIAATILIVFQSAPAQERITIDLSSRGAEVPASMYGIFFEEITGSGDGGLYAEMVRNRGFEDGNLPSGTHLCDGHACAKHSPCYSNDSINAFRVDWSQMDAMNGWTVTCADGSVPVWSILTDTPLNDATPHYLLIEAGKSDSDVYLVNSGYWGMAVKEGETYDLELYASSTGKIAVRVELIDCADNAVVSGNVAISRGKGWNRYTASLVSPVTTGNLRLRLAIEPLADIKLDFISLFPRETFMGRKNGLRKDVAQMIADLKPAFIRWPGGCIVEGLTMDNRVKWKETIGQPVTRPGEYNLWGYRSTYGFGYHEFLQFCEDTGSDAMFVCNAGMSCLFRNGDYADDELLQELIEEALDAIEYALGDPSTKWGAVRAANGHPEPFPLKYVEIGNENIGSRYAANYNLFHKAIKARYPELTLITALMFSKNIEELDAVEIIDPHYYETADWFYNNPDVYDKLPDDLPYKVYVGEYAAIGRSSLYSSLAEAAFLTGAERNSDKVQLLSYAPLIENAAYGRDHLIVLNSEAVYGRSNYWVMKMFAENMPDFNLKTEIHGPSRYTPVVPQGFVGLSTGNTAVEFKDFKVMKDGELLYETDWSDFDNRWHTERGQWSVRDGLLTQEIPAGDGLVWMKDEKFADCTIELKARKLDGYEGFRVVFGGRDERHYYMADMGSHTNESVLFREIGDKGSVSLFDYRNQEPVLGGHWYDVRVEIEANNWKCYMDGELKYEYSHNDIVKHYAVSGYDASKKELVVKIVNGEESDWHTSINLLNSRGTGVSGKAIILTSESINDENSFDDPHKIIPKETELEGVSDNFPFVCPANSMCVLRIPLK